MSKTNTTPQPADTSPQLSKCHHAPVELSGGIGDFSDSDRVMTMHYVCTECKQPCDLYVVDTGPGDEIDEFLDKYMPFFPGQNSIQGELTGTNKLARDEAKDRLNRLMLTRERELLEKLKAQKQYTYDIWFVAEQQIDESIAAIDAQLNKEENHG